ncbi:sel1 repeat family protein [cyanobacterium G8-9]|nr:sel1 repeat family protein [cyanobacterium G8-9]
MIKKIGLLISGVALIVTLASAGQVEKDLELCEKGDRVACNFLGNLYEKGSSSPYYSGLKMKINSTKAIYYYRKSCKMKNTSSCFSLGVIYAKGKGIKKDLIKAVEAYSKACDGGHDYACNNLAVIYEQGAGVPQDNAKALSLYAKACKIGDDIACQNYDVLNKK